MSLVPESIRSNATESYDLTFKARLAGLNLSQLLFVMKYETNPVKLQLYLEMFGIDGNLFDFLSLNDTDRVTLFANLLLIKWYSGTRWSIIEMAKALGASNAAIVTGDMIFHDGSINHDGTNFHDSGIVSGGFVIVVNIYGISSPEQAQYEVNFRMLFDLWQPIRIYLRQVVFL